MQELDKILEEIETLQDVTGWDLNTVQGILEIIRKHMNNGWIPVEQALPEDGVSVLATIKNHEWIVDNEMYYPENFITTLAVCDECGFWRYAEVEYGEITETQADYKPSKNLYAAVSEVVAWQPLPEPYRPEGSDNHDRDIL